MIIKVTDNQGNETEWAFKDYIEQEISRPHLQPALNPVEGVDFRPTIYEQRNAAVNGFLSDILFECGILTPENVYELILTIKSIR